MIDNMLLTPVISRTPETDPALDQQQLYRLGLDHVRRLSRRLWTDHNIHDPGITTLELLCYALTDLGYRAQFPIQDLLATEKDNADNMAAQFFTPRQILPNRPLTINDYRKLLIDMKGVKNAWLMPAQAHYFADTIHGELLHTNPGGVGIKKIDLKGLYTVLIEFDATITSDAGRDQIKAAARTLLQANRNLCEDFIAIEQVQDQFYSLCAELELEPNADQAVVAARLQFEVERYLSPPVLNASLSDMMARRHPDGSLYTVAEIFEGPLLEHGFIDDAELEAAELRENIYLSDIISIIMDIEGVRAVRDIIINPLSPGDKPTDKPNAPPDKWRLAVPSGKQPRLSDSIGRLVFYKRNMPVKADTAQVKVIHDDLVDALQAKLDTSLKEDLPIPLGRFRNTANFQSFQHHFPVTYGLSSQGLPADANQQRKALALQLKGYLLFFDQVMANYFAQLASVRTLFSRNPKSGPSYFAQVVKSFPDYQRVYAKDISERKLTGILENGASAMARRNRFLDHLLARFAEDFHHYIDIMHSAFGAGLESVIATKCAFLNDYPQLGAERALAYNSTLTSGDALWNSLNISGLERRLARLLGIHDFSRRTLSEISYEMDTEIEKISDTEYRFRIKHPVSKKTLLLAAKNYATTELAHAAMLEAIQAAQQPQGYQREINAENKHYFNIINTSGEVIAQRLKHFATLQAMNSAINALMTHLHQQYSGEGLYLIENILLRPHGTNALTDPFMRICVDPNCSDCADADPYSYRLHIVLPAFAGRFRNMDFRRFVEETIRHEIPAHILPKICWIDKDDMAKLEVAYRDWIALQAGTVTDNRTLKLQSLINALYSIKNIYPTERLHDCDGNESKSPFVLGSTALGTVKNIS